MAKVDASQVLAAAREALGGEARLAGVKNFVATGRTRQVRGDNLLPIEFEIATELPDKYGRKDEIPAQESGPTSTGFNGEDLIQRPVPNAPPAGGPPRGGPPPGARTATVKQDFARLTLGMFATSFPSFPLTFTHAGLAEAPQGEADVLDVKGPGNFAVRYFIDRKTHLPIMVSWTVPATNVVVAEATPIEHRVYYSDYRAVDGLQFPFRLRRAVGGQTIEETAFDRFRINTKIDPRRFDVRK